MIYTVEDVLDAAAEWVGDPEKDRATSSALQQAFQSAWANLLGVRLSWRLPDIQRPLFAVIPARSTRINASKLVTDFSTPIAMWDRGSSTSVAISFISPGTPAIVTTASPHARATNDEVEVIITGGSPLDGIFFVNVLSPTTLELIGSTSTDVFGVGTLIYGTQEWVPVQESGITIPPIAAISQHISYWYYQQGIVFIDPSTEAREVMIMYNSSGAPPITGYLGIDEAKDFLSHATALYFAGPNDQDNVYTRERRHCFGVNGEPDGRGGLLRAACMPALLKQQSLTRRPQPFRPRRDVFYEGLISA